MYHRLVPVPTSHALQYRTAVAAVFQEATPPTTHLSLFHPKVMIVYAVICRSHDAAVLVENYSPELGGNAPQVTVALLERLRDHPEFLPPGERKIFAQRNDTNDFFGDIFVACTGGVDNTDGGLMEHFFHVWHVGGVFYSCLSDDPDVRSHQV
jgi:hypothetical protein